MYFTAAFENGEVVILQRPWARIFHVGADQDVTTTQENAFWRQEMSQSLRHGESRVVVHAVQVEESVHAVRWVDPQTSRTNPICKPKLGWTLALKSDVTLFAQSMDDSFLMQGYVTK